MQNGNMKTDNKLIFKVKNYLHNTWHNFCLKKSSSFSPTGTALPRFRKDQPIQALQTPPLGRLDFHSVTLPELEHTGY